MDLKKFQEKSGQNWPLAFLVNRWNILSLLKPHAGKQVVLPDELVIGPGAHMPGNQYQ